MAGLRAALAVALLAYAAIAAARHDSSLPAWARDPVTDRWLEYRFGQLKDNQRDMARWNREGVRFDFMLYGCSIVKLLQRYRGSRGAWDSYFRGYQTAPMGLSGSDVADVTWRILAGGERPRRAPRVIGFLMAGHDDLWAQPEMDWLMGWLQREMPQTKILLMAILPFRNVDVRKTNARYKAVARKHGATFLDCSAKYDTTDTSIVYDGGHPTLKGQGIILDCLAPVVKRLLRD